MAELIISLPRKPFFPTEFRVKNDEIQILFFDVVINLFPTTERVPSINRNILVEKRSIL